MLQAGAKARPDLGRHVGIGLKISQHASNHPGSGPQSAIAAGCDGRAYGSTIYTPEVFMLFL